MHVQGYGLTETCGVSFVANPYQAEQARTVGPPVAGVDVRLECAPPLSYQQASDLLFTSKA